jgi:hypothetical protein
VTPEERAEAIRYCGFREPTGDFLTAETIVVVSVSLVAFGVFGVVFGDIGPRITGLFMLLGGVPACWWGWQFYKRPVAPRDDGDLAREVRHRKQLNRERNDVP